MILEESLLLFSHLCISPSPRKLDMFTNISLWPSMLIKVFNVLNLQVADRAEKCCCWACKPTSLPSSQHIRDNRHQYGPDPTTMSMFCSMRIPDARVKEFE